MRLAIIGAGPAGLYAALAAAGKGIAVDLFEKGCVGEGILCGECIFDSLGILKRPGSGFLHSVEEIILKGRKTYSLNMRGHRRLWMMDRRAWQTALAGQARACGVIVCEQEKISPARLSRLRSDYDGVIDAGGAPSMTSRVYGFTGAYLEEYLLAYQIVAQGDFSALYPRIKAGFLGDLPPAVQPAYYWIFPKDGQIANIGVLCRGCGAGDIAVDLKVLLKEVLQAEGLSAVTILKKGGGIATTRILSRLVYDNILLAGDAAGLTSALHGGGIDMACLSGVLAVEAVVQGRAGIENYRNRIVDCLKDKRAMEDVFIGKMRTLSFDAFDDLLQAAAVRNSAVRAKAALRHPDLVYTVWKWLARQPEDLPPLP